MSEDAGRGTRKQAERADRDRRSTAALRDNLRRRKEQARARAGQPVASAPAAPAPAIPAPVPAPAGSGDDRAGLSPAPLSSKTNGHGGTTAD